MTKIIETAGNTIDGKVSVLKDGKFLMANKMTERTFGSFAKAQNFVSNLIRVSNKLSLENFEFMAVSD